MYNLPETRMPESALYKCDLLTKYTFIKKFKKI